MHKKSMSMLNSNQKVQYYIYQIRKVQYYNDKEKVQ